MPLKMCKCSKALAIPLPVFNCLNVRMRMDIGLVKACFRGIDVSIAVLAAVCGKL
jgi:hypothetical protein